jgi:mRNA interferase HigB
VTGAWRAVAESAQWKTPQDIKKAIRRRAYSKAAPLVFEFEANGYRLIAVVQYENGVMMIRFFGSHQEYDKVDTQTVL